MSNNVMKPVSSSETPLLALTLALIIEGIVILALGIVDYFMNHTMYSLTPGMSALIVAIVAAVSILISPLVWKKMKIGYILSIAYFIFLIGFGISLVGPASSSTMIFRFFYIIAGVFNLIDILSPKVRKIFF